MTDIKNNRKVVNVLSAKATPLVGDLVVRRALPRRELRRLGGFVFLDHFGPVRSRRGLMDVPPHPHCGLQTVTYLFEGEIFHTDALGSECYIRPGDVNWMTAGRAITHAEQVFADEGSLHGIQTWVGLPHEHRQTEPAFEHFSKDVLPHIELENVSVSVLAGEVGEAVSPIPTFQSLTYFDVQAEPNSTVTLPVNPAHQLGIYVAEGAIKLGETEIKTGDLAHLSDDGSEIVSNSEAGARFIVLGGEPLPEPTVIYWNFVTDSLEEAKAKMADWENGKFPAVSNYKAI
jgi:quercetin 2,3-dioxygenase